jgi:hypothetical protein
VSDYEFPEELLRAQKEWFEVERQLDALPLRPWVDADGVEHRGGRGWTPDTARQEMALRKQFRDLSIEICIHPYWETLHGGTIAARMALRRAARSGEPEPGEPRPAEVRSGVVLADVARLGEARSAGGMPEAGAA